VVSTSAKNGRDAMTTFDPTPAGLVIRLVLYFTVLFGASAIITTTWPDALQYMPVGGHHALDFFEVEGDSLTISLSPDDDEQESAVSQPPSAGLVMFAISFLAMHLVGTILLMIPIAWSYMATKQDVGYNSNFARALIVLPICATTTVLLIQDSLALAFGLAALVAAVRFRVALDEAIDGIYIFAAICVGLAAGIGYLGIAAGMTVFFCFTNVLLWQFDFGGNPIERLKHERKRAKLTRQKDSL
jgi:hypothetical protein